MVAVINTQNLFMHGHVIKTTEGLERYIVAANLLHLLVAFLTSSSGLDGCTI